MLSRRSFVFDCAASVAALAVAPVGLGRRLEGDSVGIPGGLKYAAFAAQLNTPFLVRLTSGQEVAVELIKARQAPRPPAALNHRPPADTENERFSLIFSGPEASPLPSAIHQFEHARLGRFEMYFGEIGLREKGRVRYEAVFNYPVGAVLDRTI